MALAATVDATTWGPRQWPMTRDAWKRLDAVATRLTREVIATDGYVTGRLDGESDAPSFVPNIVGQQLLRQLNTVRTVLERAVVLDAPEVAVIGHRVTLREADDSTSVYELVIPGDGNPATARCQSTLPSEAPSWAGGPETSSRSPRRRDPGARRSSGSTEYPEPMVARLRRPSGRSVMGRTRPMSSPRCC